MEFIILLFLFVYLKISVIKRIFSFLFFFLYGLATSITAGTSGITMVMNMNYTHIKATFYSIKTLKAQALKLGRAGHKPFLV